LPNQYVVVAKIEWNKSWVNIDPKKTENGAVTNIADQYEWCTMQDCKNAPIWNTTEYIRYVEKSNEYPHITPETTTPTDLEKACGDYSKEDNPEGEGFFLENVDETTQVSTPRGTCEPFDNKNVIEWSK